MPLDFKLLSLLLSSTVLSSSLTFLFTHSAILRSCYSLPFFSFLSSYLQLPLDLFFGLNQNYTDGVDDLLDDVGSTL